VRVVIENAHKKLYSKYVQRFRPNEKTLSIRFLMIMKKNLAIKTFIQASLLAALVLLLLCGGVGCKSSTSDSPSQKAPDKQPEPQTPLVQGTISGIAEDDVVYFEFVTLSGQEASRGSRMGNGDWMSVITPASDRDLLVSAQVEGYEVTPAQYQIQAIGDKAFVVEDGQVTDREALDLDFHFSKP
jgi:hypothetical protein